MRVDLDSSRSSARCSSRSRPRPIRSVRW
jgi:hypothetical protein